MLLVEDVPDADDARAPRPERVAREPRRGHGHRQTARGADQAECVGMRDVAGLDRASLATQLLFAAAAFGVGGLLYSRGVRWLRAAKGHLDDVQLQEAKYKEGDLRRFALPKPGQGPGKSAREAGMFELLFIEEGL